MESSSRNSKIRCGYHSRFSAGDWNLCIAWQNAFSISTTAAYFIWGATNWERGLEDRLFKYIFARNFQHALANSPSVAKYANEIGIANDVITTIPNGHDITRFQTVIDRNAIASLGIDPNATVISFVGRFIDTKRICDLIDAVKSLVTEHENLKVILIGDGPMKKEIEEQIARLNLQKHFVLLGFRRDVPDLMRSSDLFVFPSETEGLPNSVIEAGLAKLPIVTCEARGIVDVVKNEQTALMVPTRNPTAARQCSKATARQSRAGKLARRECP